MSNMMFVLLIVALFEAFTVDGQSTFGDCEVNGLNFATETQSTILDEIRYVQNRMSVFSYKCTDFKDLLDRHLNSMNQSFNNRLEVLIGRYVNSINETLQSFSNRLEGLDQDVRNGFEFSERLQLKFDNLSKFAENHDEHIQSVGRLLEEHEEYSKNRSAASSYSSKDVCITATWKRDCADIRKLGQNLSDVYKVYDLGTGSLPDKIYLRDLQMFKVYCDMNSSTESWLVFQRRKDGSENFERNWTEYANGFGNLRGEFWLGNNALHLLTSNGNYKLRIELEDFDGDRRYAEYAQFAIGSASDNYTLSVSGYSGNAGDSLSYHKGQQFSTMDADNDPHSENCAQTYGRAWWFKQCLESNLNGRYLRGNYTSEADGVLWKTFRGLQYSLKMTEMKIAPRN